MKKGQWRVTYTSVSRCSSLFRTVVYGATEKVLVFILGSSVFKT
jgi:hypothetical protein